MAITSIKQKLYLFYFEVFLCFLHIDERFDFSIEFPPRPVSQLEVYPNILLYTAHSLMFQLKSRFTTLYLVQIKKNNHTNIIQYTTWASAPEGEK